MLLVGLLLHVFVVTTITVPAVATWADAKTNYEALIAAYTKNTHTSLVRTIPKSDQTQPVTVTLSMNLYSISDYDAVAGRIDIVGSVSLAWTDEIASLTSTTFQSTVTSALVDYSKIWTPTLVLANSAESVRGLGDSSYKVRFNYQTGQVTWNPRIIIGAACTPDVTYFPFDQQVCDFVFTPWYRDSSMVQFALGSTTWGTSDYDVNGVWEVKQTSSRVYTLNSQYYASFTLTIKRKPLYFAFNIVLPVLLLALLSGFVFLLPIASGERIGFGITCFLSFVVLMQTIMQFLPEASSPMSVLCYYVVLMMVFSGLLTIVTILLLRVYMQPEGTAVPKWLIHVVEVINCTKTKYLYHKYFKKDAVKTIEENASGKEETDQTPADVSDDTSGSGVATEVTWSSVGELLDMFFLLVFVGVQIAFTIFFLIPLGTKY